MKSEISLSELNIELYRLNSENYHNEKKSFL